MFNKSVFKVKVKLKHPLLGTVPTVKSIWSEHIAVAMTKGMKKEGKSEEEIKTELSTMSDDLVEMDEKGLTSFLKDDQGYYIRDYQVRGFLKASGTAMQAYGKAKQLKNKISMWVFIRPDKIYVAAPDAELEVCERPLRAETPQGPRTAIARSHMIPAGTELNFEIHSLNKMFDEDAVREFLSYGEYQGLGQNRGASYGAFEVLEVVEQ